MKNYIYHVGLTAWRKKTSVLVAIGLLILLILGLQFSQNEQEKAKERDDRDQSLVGEFAQIANVKFFEPYQKQKPSNDGRKTTLDEKSLSKLEQPSRDDYQRKSSDNDKTQHDMEKLLGIPFVNLDTKNPYIPKQRIVHFDLKGAPPKLSFFKKVFPVLRSMGATGLLIGTFWSN